MARYSERTELHTRQNFGTLCLRAQNQLYNTDHRLLRFNIGYLYGINSIFFSRTTFVSGPVRKKIENVQILRQKNQRYVNVKNSFFPYKPAVSGALIAVQLPHSNDGISRAVISGANALYLNHKKMRLLLDFLFGKNINLYAKGSKIACENGVSVLLQIADGLFLAMRSIFPFVLLIIISFHISIMWRK